VTICNILQSLWLLGLVLLHISVALVLFPHLGSTPLFIHCKRRESTAKIDTSDCPRGYLKGFRDGAAGTDLMSFSLDLHCCQPLKLSILEEV
jgi:hypothetical protein